MVDPTIWRAVGVSTEDTLLPVSEGVGAVRVDVAGMVEVSGQVGVAGEPSNGVVAVRALADVGRPTRRT